MRLATQAIGLEGGHPNEDVATALPRVASVIDGSTGRPGCSRDAPTGRPDGRGHL